MSTARQQRLVWPEGTDPMSERLVARTPDGLYDDVLPWLARFLKPHSRILDLGAGTGALDSRLLASGHQVTCVERDIDGFLLVDARCHCADLNENFSSMVNDKYEAITCVEVIEHLENPRHFLRQCRTLLKEGGIILITTPNIECVASRLRFLVSGHFRMFDRNESLNDRTHITPLQTFMFEKMVDDTGYEILLHKTNKPTPRFTSGLARIICKLMTPFLSGFKGGDHHIFVLSARTPRV
jgi:2-polyprenyl-3-methyl-5-hydroxy-6-metoxy-1,4-benzoquinol methylase